MKDLKHYFTDTVKACEANNESKEVTKEPASAKTNEEEAKAISPTSASARKKRGRVKIKISQNNAKGTVCNIVESKSDLVDKTPSPFAPRDVKDDENTQNDTPKRSTSLPRKSTKTSLLKMANKKASAQSENKDISPDKNGNKIPATQPKTGETTGNNGSTIFVEPTANTEIPFGDREESNAFQVLMTRKKLVQYNAPATLTSEEEEAAAKAAEESRNKLKQNKQKLIALADKKGYSKRKLEETEEAEKIERRLEKRAKVFKQMDKKENDEKNLGRRVSPGSLHNYFSKTTPVQKEKELTAVSTLVVQAEVHTPDLVDLVNVEEMQEVKMMAMDVNEETVKILETVDEIQITESDNLIPTEVSSNQQQINQRRSKKQRWSLRINLSCNEETAETDSPIANGDKTTRGKRESKNRKSKEKATNYEENEDSDLEVVNVKSNKKRKPPSSVQKNNGVTKAEMPREVLHIEPEILPAATVPKSPEPEIIEVKISKSQTAEKLAPLFVKRPKPDPAIVEARRLFLRSIPAENENPRTERKAAIVGTPILPFPTISHVAQLDVESQIEVTHFKSKFPIRENCSFSPSFILNEFKSVNDLKNNSSSSSNDSVAITKGNLDEVLSEIESCWPGAREMWKRISATANSEETSRTSPKRRARKRKSNEKKTEISNDKTSYAATWTQKYRPLSAQDIVGNEDAADKLRKWLDGWKTPLRRDDNSSGDEFYSSDCSFASNFDNNQVAVLLGPHGSGKTASVYAVAEELGYSVLEINASSKRAGKKLLKELEEATKSHRIKKPEAISLAPLVKEKKAIPKKSLILVEDVDLIFEEDEGFISATCQLASNTKRPIVMTGRDSCSHLNRMAPQQHRIFYQKAVGSRVSALLELITLAESGYRLPRPCLDRLLQNGDLRKALLQLQYLLLSGAPRASEVPTNFHRSLWQDMRHGIYKPAIKATRKSSKKKLTSQKDENVINGLAKDLHNLSLVSTLIEIEDPALEFSPLKLEPSLSLDENTHAYSSTNNTSEEIARWIRDRVISGKEAIDSGGSGLNTLRQISLKKDLCLGVNFALSQVSANTLDSQILAVDYLPAVRTICRAEDVRVTTNSKRGNRFFHYLRTLRLPSTSTRPTIFAAACKMMREKSNSES